MFGAELVNMMVADPWLLFMPLGWGKLGKGVVNSLRYKYSVTVYYIYISSFYCHVLKHHIQLIYQYTSIRSVDHPLNKDFLSNNDFKKFKYLDNNLNSILKLKQPFIENAILNSCNLKKMVVQKDEDEKNLRKILNLGHTFAHAFESCLGFSSKLNHGEAVIIGITIALEFSYQRRLIKNKTYNFIKKHLERIPLKKKFTSIFNKKDVSKIISFMKSDKKNTTKKINIILIKDFGKIKTNYQFDQNTLKQFLISELKK